MKHIVSYSGGLNSFMTAQLVVNDFGAANVLLVFTDTKSEDYDLYRFIDETVKHLEADYICLQEGRDIWQVYNDMNFMSNSRVDNCSDILKRSLFKRWLKKNYKPQDCILYMGFDWNEEHRLEKVRKRYKPYRIEASLIKDRLEKQTIIDYLKFINIKIPRLYDLGFSHNNCGGFCVKAGLAHFKNLYKQLPERYKYHEDQQEALFNRIGKHGFLKMTENGKTKYLSLKDFREQYLEKDKQVDMFDIGGCGCFT